MYPATTPNDLVEGTGWPYPEGSLDTIRCPPLLVQEVKQRESHQPVQKNLGAERGTSGGVASAIDIWALLF